jgi:hypothetical protein
MEILPWGKMEVASNFVHLQRSIYIAPFTFFFLYFLNPSFSLALFTVQRYVQLRHMVA